MIKKNDNILIVKLLIIIIMLIVTLILIQVNAATLQIEYNTLQSLYKKEQKRFNERTEPVYNFEQDLAIMAAIAKVYEQEFMNISERIAQKTAGMASYEVHLIKWVEYVDGLEDELYDEFYMIFERLDMWMDFSSGGAVHIYYAYGGYSGGTFGVVYVMEEGSPIVSIGGLEKINYKLYAFYYNIVRVQRPDYNNFNIIQEIIEFPQIPMAIKVYPLIQPIKRKEF